MSGRFGGDWANPLQGHAIAALPRSAMKLRRLMQIARRGQSLPKRSVVRHSKIGPPMSQMGHSRHSCHPDKSGSPQERTCGQCPRL